MPHLVVGGHMHTPGAHGLKSMLPAAKMCTQGAGCTLNFEHWKCMQQVTKSHLHQLSVASDYYTLHRERAQSVV